MSAADKKLLAEVARGNTRAVDELIRCDLVRSDGSAHVDGSDQLHARPIFIAASHGESMVGRDTTSRLQVGSNSEFLRILQSDI